MWLFEVLYYWYCYLKWPLIWDVCQIKQLDMLCWWLCGLQNTVCKTRHQLHWQASYRFGGIEHFSTFCSQSSDRDGDLVHCGFEMMFLRQTGHQSISDMAPSRCLSGANSHTVHPGNWKDLTPLHIIVDQATWRSSRNLSTPQQLKERGGMDESERLRG